MKNKTLKELSALLHTKKISSLELTQYYLTETQNQNAQLNAFITIDEAGALAAAKVADERIAKNTAHALTGIPMAHKDLFCTKGLLTSSGSKILENFIAPYDAHIVEKYKAAGLVCLGKLNMDEFAMGSTNGNSYYGAVANPWDHKRVPGGSSGGSAAAVAAGMVAFATASDTGGSIRQPASFCGVTGIKPTYGRVSRFGMIAFASSLDQAGVIAKTAEDCALSLEIMAGYDPRDSTSIRDIPPLSFDGSRLAEQLGKSLAGLRIGIPKEFFGEGLDPKVATVIQNAIQILANAGAIIKEISLPNTSLVVPAYYIIAPAEASSNLSRFDGVRYGYRCENPKDLKDLYQRSRSEGFGAEVKRRIMIGTYVLSAGFYDAYYNKAQKIRRIIANDYQNVFQEVDIIAGPTAPTPAFLREGSLDDTASLYLSDIFTIGANLSGLPAMSLPAGFADGLPVGMQLIGQKFDEVRLLQVAHQFQQLTDWHTKTPA